MKKDRKMTLVTARRHLRGKNPASYIYSCPTSVSTELKAWNKFSQATHYVPNVVGMEDRKNDDCICGLEGCDHNNRIHHKTCFLCDLGLFF